MEAVTCRLLPDAIDDGPTNMAIDEVLVRQAVERQEPALRFYQWSSATVSLGYFQPAEVRLSDPRLAKLPWVRRPSGGATLVHHHELTYALAIPPNLKSPMPWMPRMHQIIAHGLASLGVPIPIELKTGDTQRHGQVLCFQQFTPGDLLCATSKIVGSAQRKYHLALLQHGSILLAQSEHTPSLPGLRELTGQSFTPLEVRNAILRTFAADTGWTMEDSIWDEAELMEIQRLVSKKYGHADWNEKR